MAKVLAKVLFLKDDGKKDEALKEIDDALSGTYFLENSCNVSSTSTLVNPHFTIQKRQIVITYEKHNFKNGTTQLRILVFHGNCYA